MSAEELISELAARGLTIAVAESLTGGLLVAELIRPPGASVVVLGGVVAYNSDLKRTILGVDAALLDQHGPVHAEVAAQMARNVRERLAVGGVPASIGLSTTGVAGPGPADGHPAGTAFVGVATGIDVRTVRLSVSGPRSEVRAAVVTAALAELSESLAGIRR